MLLLQHALRAILYANVRSGILPPQSSLRSLLSGELLAMRSAAGQTSIEMMHDQRKAEKARVFPSSQRRLGSSFYVVNPELDPSLRWDDE